MSVSAEVFGGGGAFGAPAYGFQPVDDLETDEMPDVQVMRRRPTRRETHAALARELVGEILPELPEPGSSVHIVGNGRFDYWTWTPHLLELLAAPADLWASTWTMNRGNALELLALLDAGKLRSVAMFTGLYFKRRESAVYATLLEGLLARGQRFLAFENHAKLLVLRTDADALVVEGSANFTANPRVEQYVVTRDPELAEFHVRWLEKMLRR